MRNAVGREGTMATSSLFLASDGGGYELQMGRWSRRLAPKFIEFAGIKDADSVLDVGCGTGSLASTLALNPGIREVHGIDFSAAYIEYAKQTSGSKVRYQVGDACALPFADGKFDHSLSMLVLQFIPQPEKAIDELRRVTRPGGTVAAATWDSRGGFVWLRMFWDTAAMLDPVAGERRARICARPLTRPRDLERAWKAAGLTGVVQDMLTVRMDFESFVDFWAPLEGSDGPYAEYVRTLSPQAKAVLQDKVRLAYVDGEADGPRSYAATAWVVKGNVPI
jgi:SAM-dependent methyltransferase